MEKSKLLFCQKLVNLQNLKNVTHIIFTLIFFYLLENPMQELYFFEKSNFMTTFA